MADGIVRYRRNTLIGKGAYARVYEVTSPSGTKKALKCHLKNKNFDFNLCIRELDINNMLSHHPNILPLTKITLGHPFTDPSSPLVGEDMNYSRENISFIFPLGSCHLRNYMSRKDAPVTYDAVKTIMMEVLLGVEYMHKSGYIHRDIKPDNIIMVRGDDGKHVAKVADFGLAKSYIPNVCNTPGVTTSWFRSPEVCLGYSYYDAAIDIWAVGCTFYQIISGDPLFLSTNNDNVEVLKNIISVIPYTVPKDTMVKYDMDDILKKVPWLMSDKPYVKFFKLSDSFVRDMQAGNMLKIFYDFMFGLICIDPEKRFTATKALDHVYFARRKPIIENARMIHALTTRPAIPARIYPDIGRRYFAPIAIGIYNTPGRVEWCPDRALFHSIYIMDRAIHHCMSTPYYGVEKLVTRDTSRFKMEVQYISCVYLAIKYFPTMMEASKFGARFPPEYSSAEAKAIAGKFEEYVLSQVYSYTVGEDTIYEIAHRHEKVQPADLYGMFTLIVSGHHDGKTPIETYEFWKLNREYYRNAASSVRVW